MIHLLRKLPHDQDYDDAVSNEVERKRYQVRTIISNIVHYCREMNILSHFLGA